MLTRHWCARPHYREGAEEVVARIKELEAEGATQISI